MKPLSIQKTTDAYPGLTDKERKDLLLEEVTEMNNMREQVKKAMGWNYTGFSDSQIRFFHKQIFK